MHVANFGQRSNILNNKHIQNTAWALIHPLQHPRAGWLTPWTPPHCDMACCWQIDSILVNIGRKNSIRILNQYPFWWNKLIWAQFIVFITIFSF